MRKLLLALSVALAGVFTASAQITYPSTDFGVAGDSLFYTKVTLSTQTVYYFFQAGANQTWNYSTFTPTTQFDEDYLSPTTAGYRATFLTECVAGGSTLGTCRTDFNTLTNLALPTNADQTISTYTFTDVIDMDYLSANSLETNILGLTARLNGINVPFTATLTSPDVIYNFPITYTDRDSSVSGYVIDLTSQGINLIYRAHSKRVNHEDAWGNLTTPYSNYPSTVRQRSTVLHTDTLFYDGQVLPVVPTTNVTYSWFADAEKGPVFIAFGTVGATGQEYYSKIEYLDTIHCLTPTATQVHNPALATIGATGSVAVNFNSTSINANNYTWSFDDPGSGANNTSTSADPTHTYTTSGTYTCELIACNTVCSPERCDTDLFTVKVVDSGQVHAGFIALPAVTCTNDTVKFTNNSINATSYSWNFGDNTTSTLKTPSHVYTAAGTYLVTLVASDGGLTDTATRTVTIQAPPAPVITPNGPTNFCNGDSVILAGSGGTIYHWSTGQVSDNITVRISGTYTLTADNTCGSAVSTPITVTVTRPVDTITTLGATTFCSGDSVILQANTGAGLTYQWRDNGQIIINATQNTYTAKTTGNYTVNVTDNGCRGLSNIIAVTVNPTPAATITLSSSSVICSGDSLKLTASLNAANTYQWHLNGTDITGATNRTYYAHTAGTYTVFISRNGCSATSNGIVVTVNPTPAPVIVTSGSNAVCNGDSVLLTTQSGAGYTYQWLLGGNAITGATSETYYAKTQGSYTVTISALGCSGTSSAQSIIVNPTPTANAGSGATLAGCNAPSSTLGDGTSTASGGTGPYHYQWSPASSLSNDTIYDPTVSHLGSTQVYTLLVTDANGCTATSSTTVTVTGSHVAISVALTGDSAWCFGSSNSLSMDASVTGSTGTVTYQWTPATDLSSTNTASTVASPTAVGSYTYNVIATDALSCQAGTSVTINIYPQPTANITANNTTTPCSGDSVNFSANIGAGYSYQWLDGGTPISGATNVNFATPSAGSYSVSVSEGICSATSTAIPVTVKPVPPAVLNAHGSLSFCAGTSVGMVASIGAYSYQWYEDGQSIAGDTLNSITVTDSGTFNVLVSENGCSATSNSLTTNVIPNPADSIAAGGVTTFCVGNTVTLYASPGLGYTYQWQNNTTNISGQTTDSLVVDSNGTYTVVVTALGCSLISLGIPVTVYYYPTASIATSGSVTFCGGDSVTLGAVQGPGYSYQWQNDGTPLNGAVNVNLTTPDSGSYNVVVTQNGCTDTSNSIYVTVIALPGAAAYVSSTSGLVCPNDSFYVYVAAAPGSTYQWQLAGNDISGATNDTFATNVLGTYDVLVTNNGCVGVSNPLTVGNYNTTTPTINVAGNSLVASVGVSYQWYSGSSAISGATQQSYSPPSAGTYSVLVTDSNGCTQMSAAYSATGIGSISELAQVSVYPNPAHESISVAINTTSESFITIAMYDIIGHEVAIIFSGSKSAGNYVHQASTSTLASGIYLVKISDGTSTIVKRISVEH